MGGMIGGGFQADNKAYSFLIAKVMMILTPIAVVS